MRIHVVNTDVEERAEEVDLGTLRNPSSDFWFEPISGKVYTGKSVTEDTALTFSAFYAAVRIRSHAISTLPLILYRRVGPNKVRAINHPLYPILKNSPNNYQTTQEWLEQVSIHKDMLGNSLSVIIRNGAQRVSQLIPVHPGRVQVEVDRDTREPFYIIDGNTHNPWSMNEALHFKDLSLSGYMGISKIRAAKQAIGYGLGLEEFGARFVDNDASSGLVIVHPGSIGDKGVKGLKKQWEDASRGKNRHRARVLQEGAKVEKITIAPEDAQFLESRQFSIQEIARFMGVPPHMLSDLSKSSFNNIEEQGLDFLFNTVRPELVKIEQKINKVLLGNSEDFFVEFLFDARARADLASRYNAFSTGINAGFLTANEVRSFENLPQIEGGDTLRVPLNTAPVGQASIRQYGEDNKKKKKDKEKKRQITDTTSEANDHTHRVTFPDSSEEGGEVRTTPGGVNDHTHTVEYPAFEEGESFSYTTSREEGHTHSGTVNERNLPQNMETRQLPRQVSLRDEIRSEFREAADEILNEEVPQLRRILERATTAERLERELEDFFEQHQVFVRSKIEPLYRRFANNVASSLAEDKEREVPDIDEFIEKVIDSAVLRWTRSSRLQLEDLEDNESRSKRLDEWEEKRAAKFADSESTQIQGAAAKAAFIGMGFTRLVWRTRGKNCPFCERLNGRTIDINGAFLLEGDSIDGEGGTLVSNKKISQPGAHRGCDCYLDAE